MVEPHDEDKGLVLTEEQLRRRKARNVAIAVALFVLVVLFYLVTVFKMGGNVANRPL
ncbi:hypothetical protein [Chenggangzhangella methanolivorans]|uniref:Protoheme IX farnesyltransferase n=1 Tax=Chenggangzhangella methanolivorans TaxID=1437009 RepID=A0A9E6R8W2_9HYPH|nr:hypothetical protein [Chenggangzhangella methanolivorans]QZN98767.1 hypothetical protein K6K41_17590 [Chenggangzhangella methanolivorans]